MASPDHSKCQSPTSTMIYSIRNDDTHQKFQENFIPIYSEMRTRQRKAIEIAGSMKVDPFFSFAHISDTSEQYFHSSYLHPFAPSLALSSSSSSTKAFEETKQPSDDLPEQEPKHDSRRCLAISAILHKDHSAQMEWTPAFLELQKRLSNFPGLHFVEDSDKYQHDKNAECFGQLHWTLMQLVGFNDYNDFVEKPPVAGGTSPFLASNYLNTVQNSLTEGGLDCAITIEFTGVIAVSTGLLMVGIPSMDINLARDTVRNNLKTNDLPLMEPFVNDIVHSTLFRVVTTDFQGYEQGQEEKSNLFHTQKELSHELLAISKKYENVSLGKVTLRHFQVGPASWRMLSSEMKDTPPVREWTFNN